MRSPIENKKSRTKRLLISFSVGIVLTFVGVTIGIVLVTEV